MASGRAGQPALLAAPVAQVRHGLTLALFTLALFSGAFLLFWVQPLFTRMVLPLLGGSPSVWNTALVFFQGALLVGYGYVHLTSRWLPIHCQAVLHLMLLCGALVSLPIEVGSGWVPPVEGAPVLWLIGLLIWCLGLPFVVVSATAPLLQRWFAASDHPAARDPYFLYGASNLGSVVALLGYPLLLEPGMTLGGQSLAWTLGYLTLCLMVAGCALGAVLGPATGAGRGQIVAEEAAPLTWGARASWIALSFVPSSLLLGVTTHITTDVAAAPLFWVIPLALYLLTFVLTFARRPIPGAWMVKLQPSCSSRSRSCSRCTSCPGSWCRSTSPSSSSPPWSATASWHGSARRAVT